MVPLRAVRATMPGEAEHTTGKVGGADGALAKGAFEMGKAGFFFRGCVAVPSTDDLFCFFSGCVNRASFLPYQAYSCLKGQAVHVPMSLGAPMEVRFVTVCDGL